VDPVPDPLLLRKSGSAGNRTQDVGGKIILNGVDWIGWVRIGTGGELL
jgi:hypothetical protein